MRMMFMLAVLVLADSSISHQIGTDENGLFLNRNEVIEKYKEYLNKRIEEYLKNKVLDLKGKGLGCFRLA
jgi:hypothetical protein